MEIAEEIYPGMKGDPNKKFVYTAALAITSQGEMVIAHRASWPMRPTRIFLETRAIPRRTSRRKDKNIKRQLQEDERGD